MYTDGFSEVMLPHLKGYMTETFNPHESANDPEIQSGFQLIRNMNENRVNRILSSRGVDTALFWSFVTIGTVSGLAEAFVVTGAAASLVIAQMLRMAHHGNLS